MCKCCKLQFSWHDEIESTRRRRRLFDVLREQILVVMETATAASFTVWRFRRVVGI